MSCYITVDDDIIQPQIWSFDCAKIKRNDGTAAGTSEKWNLASYKSRPAVTTKCAALKCTCGALMKRKELWDVVCITIWQSDSIFLSVAAPNELDAISVKPCAGGSGVFTWDYCWMRSSRDWSSSSCAVGSSSGATLNVAYAVFSSFPPPLTELNQALPLVSSLAIKHNSLGRVLAFTCSCCSAIYHSQI